LEVQECEGRKGLVKGPRKDIVEGNTHDDQNNEVKELDIRGHLGGGQEKIRDG